MQLPKPNYFLGIGGKSHGAMTGEMIVKLEEIMLKEKPDVVLVYGDTNSTLAGLIAASKLYISIAHVEAGLRSFNMKMLEEINRILTDRVSSWLFCPTDKAVENLKKEGFISSIKGFGKVIKVGDVMYDAVLYYKRFAKKPDIDIDLDKEFILCTIHRLENTDNPERLKNIFEAIKEIGKEITIVLPLHPRTQKRLKEFDIYINNLQIIKLVRYLEMIWLLNNCKIIITDSGGLQKEAFFFKKPCITLRDETEWVKLIDIKVNILVTADKDKIIKAFSKLKNIQNLNFNIDFYVNGKTTDK